MERILYLTSAFCAVSEDGRLTEYIPTCGTHGAGDILIGKVDRMMSGMGCAFVNIGRKKDGFLPMHENSATFTDKDFRSGEPVIVQIKKEETGEKGAFLTRDVTLADEHVILMPKNRHVGVSSRITDEEIRNRLKTAGERIAKGRFGLVLRSTSSDIPESVLQQETELLFRKWTDAVQPDSITNNAGYPILHENSVEEEMIRDYSGRGIKEIIRDTELNADMKRQLYAAKERRIRLHNGGNIVIDRCEALTVIDVNTASAAAGKNKRETVMKTNMEACEEIATQIRLRNISGIIIIDMIDLDERDDREKILDHLRTCFDADRTKTVVHGITELGLIEMTRKRTRPELTEMLEDIAGQKNMQHIWDGE